jgi:iron(III) transport system substrate-binding protein
MKIRAFIILGLLALIVGLPLALRVESSTTSPDRARDRLVILSPHNESIRQELGEAFADHWRKSTGRTLYVDWRTPGGTSEIRMVIDAGFKAAAETGREGIGVDLFFGGGTPDFIGQEKQNRLAPLDVFKNHPDWFGESGVIPETFTGERYYSKNHQWVATCMSQFGICYNPDVLERLKLSPPVSWDDLGDEKYRGALALADPTKSGSVARSFELMVQDQIQRALKNTGVEREIAIATGWQNGLQLIQRLAANARYFTDSASKIPQDVGQGNAAAGMCIDFYGRSYASELTTRRGNPRVVWIAPKGGTTLSGDPIAVFKGAPSPALAQAFVEFCLTPEAQNLWFAKVGTPHGPRAHALFRTPIRKDVYTRENLSASIMPEAHPYTDDGNFTYQPDLTGRSFNALRQLVKIMCIDSHDEMKSAWNALAEAGMPADALAVFQDVSIMPYSVGGQGDPLLDQADVLKAAQRANEIGQWFRTNYRTAEAMARLSKSSPTP